MKKMIRRILKTISTVLIVIVVILGLLLVGVKATNIQVYGVLSGSMEPTYKTGSVVYVKEVDTSELEAGDVITYQLDADTLVTHRIVEITEENGERAFVTKGDANEYADGGAVPENQVAGTPIFTIPYLGYLAMYIQSASGRYASIAFVGVVVLLMILPDMFFKDEKDSLDDKETLNNKETKTEKKVQDDKK